MKQHITREQLNELTEEQKEKLREWWKPEYGDQYETQGIIKVKQLVVDFEIYNSYQKIQNEDCDYDGCPYYDDKKNTSPLLSIGQMIEFLGVDDLSFSDVLADDYMEHGITFKKKENWCDALWEAVKKAL